MKLTELIDELKALLEEHGDVETVDENGDPVACEYIKQYNKVAVV